MADIKIIITLLIAGISCCAARPKLDHCIAIFTKLECETLNTDVVHNTSCFIKPNKLGIPTLNADFYLLQDVHNLTTNFRVQIQRDKFIANHSAIELDVCQALTARFDNYLYQMIAMEFRRVSNFPLKCPFRKNKHYFFRGYDIDVSILPTYTPELKFMSFTILSTNGLKLIRYDTAGRITHSRKKNRAAKILQTRL